MKIALLVLLILCTAAAFGQATAMATTQPQALRIPDHPQHAERQALATEKPLVGAGTESYSYAKGERPLWEFGSDAEATPLGDVARAFRKEKLTSKKAEIVLEKQGS